MPQYKKTVSIPGKSSQELYQTVSSSIDIFLSKTGLGGYELTKDAEKKQIFANSKLFSATLICEEETLILDVNLSLFAAPFRSKLDGAIEKWVDKNFLTK